ncbi:MAG: hypothetical protein QGF53_04855, partial [Alphaproteobacteria bacterium]|nr:hypothetical protein [Alphaproteobacteria bacterium]
MQKRLVEILLIVLFLGAVAALTYQGLGQIERETRRSSGAALHTVLLTVEEALHLWTGNRIRDAQTISAHPAVVASTEELLRLSGRRDALLASGALRLAREFIEQPVRFQGYPGFLVIGPDFNTLVSMWDDDIGAGNLIAERKPDTLSHVFAGRSVIIPAVIAEPALGDALDRSAVVTPAMYVATPIVNDAGDVIAALAIELDPVGDFSRVTGLGRIGVSGETYAFDADGFLLSESRFDHQLRDIGMIRDTQQSVMVVRIVDPGWNMVEGGQAP